MAVESSDVRPLDQLCSRCGCPIVYISRRRFPDFLDLTDRYAGCPIFHAPAPGKHLFQWIFPRFAVTVGTHENPSLVFACYLWDPDASRRHVTRGFSACSGTSRAGADRHWSFLGRLVDSETTYG